MSTAPMTDDAKYADAHKVATAVAESIPGFIEHRGVEDVGLCVFLIWAQLTQQLVLNGWDENDIASHLRALSALARRKHDA
jgi:hypothetical protein